MRNELFIKNFQASGAIEPHRIVKFAGQDISVEQATDGTATLLGVADSLGADATGDPVDVVMHGIAEVVYGATITRGAALTADSDGKAVPATSGDAVIGYAGQAGEENDHGSVIIDRNVA